MSHVEPGGQVPSALHAGMQAPQPKTHSSLKPQSSWLSQTPCGAGTQPARQSAHCGQLELAQPSQISPVPQLPSSSQRRMQVPVWNWQMSPVQSSWEMQKALPLLELTTPPELVVETPLDPTPPPEPVEPPLVVPLPVPPLVVPPVIEPLPVLPVGEPDTDDPDAPPPPSPPSSSNTTVPPQAVVEVARARRGTSWRNRATGSMAAVSRDGTRRVTSGCVLSG